MRRALVSALIGISALVALVLISQPARSVQVRMLRITSVGPTPSLRVKATLVFATGAGMERGSVRYLEATTPFEMEVGPDFTLAIVERTAAAGQIEVSLESRVPGAAVARGSGTRVLIGNNLKLERDAVFVQTF